MYITLQQVKTAKPLQKLQLDLDIDILIWKALFLREWLYFPVEIYF